MGVDVSSQAAESSAATPPYPISWFHSFELPGETLSGGRPLPQLRAEADLIFKHGVAGKRVLDIGAWDGFFSFEAERRGAASVLATDHYCWSGPGVGAKTGFDYVHHKLGSKVESLDIDVPDFDPKKQGTFDVVLLMGVLYHVEDPYRVLKAAAAMTSDLLVVETETALEHEPIPAMRLYEPGELRDDPTNIWAPNTAALKALLTRMGFTRLEVSTSPSAEGIQAYRASLRGRMRRWLVRLGLMAPLPHADRSRVIVHAWR